MNISVLAFALMGSVVVAFYAATLAQELDVELLTQTQTGHRRLSGRSVKWLVGTAFIGALLLCFSLM